LKILHGGRGDAAQNTDAVPHDAAAAGLALGLDTGGTFTDAVVLCPERRVIASAKSLTTPWDLAVGIGHAIRNVRAALPARDRRRRVTLVCVSTTLATNAIVENRVSPVCTLLIGFDAGMVLRSGLDVRDAGVIVRIDGGHGATGEESAPLDEAAVARAVTAHESHVEAFAVAANFSVRNPAHERRAREIIRALSPKPVTCAYELSSQLDAPRRALTATLNARLTPPIGHLLEALARVLAEEAIAAPLMIVKGDGTLMRAEVALEYPVETILSGPAASVVGAAYLTGLNDFLVSDMGGTTTDIAVVAAGRAVISGAGALVGGWRTMVEAVDVRTSGLGGDSEVGFTRDFQLRMGPRKAMPLALLASRFPGVLEPLRAIAAQERLPEYPTQFAFRNPDRNAAAHLSALERGIFDALTPLPQPLGSLVRNRSGLDALRRLADAGLATLAAFTPSDAMHVLGHQQDWCREAAVHGARILSTEERNGRALRAGASPEEICARTHEWVVRETGRALLGAALGIDPGIEPGGPPGGKRWGLLGGRLVDAVVAGRSLSRLLAAKLDLAVPLVAIGAPVGAYYPEVARRLGATLTIPEFASVCNAVGAVAGVVSESVEILVDQPSFQVFRVHDPAGSRDYAESPPALAHATRISRELALAAARRAGAHDPDIETRISEKRAQMGAGADYLAEAVVRSTATGRPVVATV
jgi:N-methylhydantoinase A/oxoprolinase/acetone carboxylase beta subunit